MIALGSSKMYFGMVVRLLVDDVFDYAIADNEHQESCYYFDCPEEDWVFEDVFSHGGLDI